MQHFMIPICYFPSTVLMLDDEKDFLRNTFFQNDKQFMYRVFKKAEDCFAYMSKQAYVFKHCHSFAAKHVTGLAAVYAEIYNPARFSEISVLVVDQKRLDMDGLIFCQNIQLSPIKRILLIDDDETSAAQAVKEQWIHAYINKKDPQWKQKLVHIIHTLQRAYFQDISRLLGRLLGISLPAWINTKEFTSFFQQSCLKKHIAEYYLFNVHGDFLMLDKNAHLSFLQRKDGVDLASEHDFTQCYVHVEGAAKIKELAQKKIFSYQDYSEEVEVEAILV